MKNNKIHFRCCRVTWSYSPTVSVLRWFIYHNRCVCVLQYSGDNQTKRFDDAPARFGYRLPSHGLKVRHFHSACAFVRECASVGGMGVFYIFVCLFLSVLIGWFCGQGFLISARPENGCVAVDPPPIRENSSSNFIVLMKRYHCNFDIKVSHTYIHYTLQKVSGQIIHTAWSKVCGHTSITPIFGFSLNSWISLCWK